MNKATLHGFTGKDPEIRTTESGKKIARFTIATTSFRKDASGNKLTEWHSISAWEKLAELCEKYIKKGSELIVEGEITYRTYTDKEGVVKYITEIVASSIEFCGKKESNSVPDKQGEWQGKQSVKSMSDINELGPIKEEDPLF